MCGRTRRNYESHPNVLTALTELAVSVFRGRADANNVADAWFDTVLISDAVLREAQRESLRLLGRQPPVNDVVTLAFSEPELAGLATRAGEPDPMLLHPGGGSRMSPTYFVIGLLSSAFLEMYFLRLPTDEGTFVRAVLEGFEELRRAARGERIRAHAITGIARATLPEGTQVSTPWGVVRPAPPSPSVPTQTVFPSMRQPRTTCVLAEPRLLPVRFDRAPSPQQSFDPSEAAAALNRPTVLFPLACALASKETAKPVVPLLTWSVLLLPFQIGFGYSMPVLAPTFGTDVSLGDGIGDLEE